MFLDTEIHGDRLPPGTVCLTYDDGPGQSETGEWGPGPRTLELGGYLQSLGVPATFFAVGKFASKFGNILATLRSLGHLVANHTFDHPSLPAFVASGGDAHDQLARTDALIRDHVVGPVTFFRPPYGDWWLNGQSESNVAASLNRSPLAARYVGPIGWDIDAGDVGFWRDDRPIVACARAYLEAIERTTRGIVLMHDSTADLVEIRCRNQALGFAQILVPELLRRGYRFMRLDAVPQVVSATRVSAQWTLVANDGSSLVAPPCGFELKFVPGPAVATATALGGVNIATNQWALRAPNGHFLSPRREGDVLADAILPGERETLTVESRENGRFSMRTIDGTYLTRGSAEGQFLRADAHSPGETEVFSGRIR